MKELWKAFVARMVYWMTPKPPAAARRVGAAMAEVSDKIRVDFEYYRDCNGVLHERRRVEGRVIYDEPFLTWNGQLPYVEISLEDWPREPKEEQ